MVAGKVGSALGRADKAWELQDSSRRRDSLPTIGSNDDENRLHLRCAEVSPRPKMRSGVERW